MLSPDEPPFISYGDGEATEEWGLGKGEATREALTEVGQTVAALPNPRRSPSCLTSGLEINLYSSSFCPTPKGIWLQLRDLRTCPSL